MSKRKLPNLIIAGVVKGGTTSLYTYLSQHPDICCSTVKETCYFSAYRYGQLDSRYYNISDPYQQYQTYFQHCTNQKYIMEATPGYFEGGRKVAQEIKKQLGDRVKIIIVLREPIERLISFLKYKKSRLAINQQLTLEQYIQQCQNLPFKQRLKPENDTYWGIDGGFYSNYLNDWFQFFGDSVKILFFDDLKQNINHFLEQLYKWLDIESNLTEGHNFEVENKSVGYKNKEMQQLAIFINTKAEKFWRANPYIKKILRNIYFRINGAFISNKISDTTIQYLQEIYQPYNQKLAQQLLKQGYTKLPQWLQF
jgi:hypothetical protein